MSNIRTWRFNFHTLEVVKAQEDGILSDGDEPYFVFIGFRSKFRVPGSTQAFWSSYLEDDWANGVDSGDTRAIPQQMGVLTFPNVNLLSATDILNGAQFPEIVGFIGISLESDATPFGEIRDLMNKVRDASFQEIKRLIEDGQIDLANPAQSIQQATQNIQNSLQLTTWDKIRLFLASWTDPDDLIGIRNDFFVAGDPSLKALFSQQGVALNFLERKALQLNFEGDDAHYRVNGTLEDSLPWFEIAPAESASTEGVIAAVSRIPNSMEVWWIGSNGSVQSAYWYEGANWQRYELAPPGSAATDGSITAVSRIPNSMEVWWIGSNGSVQSAYWYEGANWQRYELAPPGSAATDGSITSVSRIPNSMEVWWIGVNGSVQSAYWYEGANWQRYELAPSGSASTNGSITAVSRIPNSMEVWWIGANGSIQDAYWYDGSPWQRFELASSGSASTNGGITAVSRIPNSMEVWWIGANGSIQDAYWYDGSPWQRFELAPESSAANNGAIVVVARIPNSMEVWWIGVNGAIRDAYWYEGTGWL
jgi:hypothetical protein